MCTYVIWVTVHKFNPFPHNLIFYNPEEGDFENIVGKGENDAFKGCYLSYQKHFQVLEP